MIRSLKKRRERHRGEAQRGTKRGTERHKRGTGNFSKIFPSNPYFFISNFNVDILYSFLKEFWYDKKICQAIKRNETRERHKRGTREAQERHKRGTNF